MADERLRYNPDGSVDMRAPDGSFVRIGNSGAGAMVDIDPNGLGSPGPAEPATAGAPPRSGLYGGSAGPSAASGLYMDAPANPASGQYGTPTPDAAPSPYDAPAPGEPAADAGWQDAGAPGPASQMRAQQQAQQASGPRFARVTNTQSQTTHQRDTPGLRGALAQVNEYAASAAGLEQARMERSLDAYSAEQDAAAKRQQIDEAHLARQQQRMAERKQATDGMRRQREAAEEKFMNAEVDPDKYWADRGTPAKILGGIGILVSGLGQSMQAAGGQTNTSNMALDMIDKAIERDIDAQKANIQKAGQAVHLLDGALANYQQEFGDQTLAEHAAYLTAYKVAEQELVRATAGNKRADIKIAIDQAAEQLKLKAAERQMAFEEAIAGKVTEQEATRMVPVTGGAAPGAKDLASPDARLAAADGGIPGFVVDNKGAFATIATDEPSYRKLRDAVSAARQMQQAANTMAKIREQYGAEISGSEPRAQYDAAKGQMIGAINLARGAGVVNDSEFERLRQEIPGLEMDTSDAARAVTAGQWDPKLNKINGIRDQILGNTDAQLQAWGGRLAGGAGGNDLPTSEQGEQAQAALREWQ